METCLYCGGAEDDLSPGLHLNPDLDLDHTFEPLYVDEADLWDDEGVAWTSLSPAEQLFPDAFSSADD